MQLPDIVFGQIDLLVIFKNRRKQIGIARDFLLVARLKRLLADTVKDGFNLGIVQFIALDTI